MIPLDQRQELPASNRDDARDLVARMNARRDRETTANDKQDLANLLFEVFGLLNTPLYGDRNIPADVLLDRCRNAAEAVHGEWDMRRRP